jgi:hypothetical protein
MSPTSPLEVGGQEALAEKGGVDAVSAVAFSYDIYINPSKNNGVLTATLTCFLMNQADSDYR